MTMEQRFWLKVSKDGPTIRPELGPCWIWTAAKNTGGYGKLAVDGRRAFKIFEDAHRVSWRLHNGVIPDGLFVLHRCDNRPCVRPEHLFIGTTSDNMQDCVSKGRFKKRGETCPNGHPWTTKNTYIHPKGSWICRACLKVSEKKWRTKQNALRKAKQLEEFQIPRPNRAER